MGYTNQEKVEGQLGRALTEPEQQNLSFLINAASRQIDRWTNSQGYISESQPSTTVYNVGPRDTQVFIDRMTTVTLVEVSDDGTNYTPAQSWTPQPASGQYVDAIYTGYGWPRYVRITGKRGGYPSVPEPIALAATILVADVFINNAENPNNLKSESIEGYSRTFGDSTGEAARAKVEHLLTGYGEILL